MLSSLSDGIGNKRKLVIADSAFDVLPLFLAALMPAELKNSLPVVFEIQSAVRLETRSDDPLAAPGCTVPYPLVDGDTNLPPHLVSGDSILNFWATWRSNRH